MSAWAYCATCHAPHQAVEVGGVRFVPCDAASDGPWLLSGDLAPCSVGIADCQRCGAPAHPIRGYCGRFCEEAARYEARQRERGPIVWRKPGTVARIAGLDPVSPEETRAAYGEAYAAIERDTDDALAAWAPTFGPALAWPLEPHPFTRERFEAGVERALRGPGDDEP